VTSVRPRARLLFLAAASLVLFVAIRAWADIEVRAAKFTWDKNDTLRGTFSYRDAIDDKTIAAKLPKGLAVNVVMRGYVYPNGGGDPVALTAHTCKIAYDLWNEVYEVVVNGKKAPPALNMKSLYRLCTDMVDLSIADRALLKGGAAGYQLAVKVEVNPVSEETLQKVQKWVTRSAGTGTGISPGDALFSSFVSVFMKKIASADKVVEFKTASFPP
jgi:hypothetical protein